MAQYSYLREHSGWQLSTAADGVTHLIEVSVDVLPRAQVQLGAADLLCESRDAYDVRRLQVLREEIAARLGHFFHLVAHRCQEDVKNALLAHCDAGGVGEVDEAADDRRTHVPQSDLRGVAFLEVAGEHGFEVRTAGSQHQFMHLENVEKAVTRN